jgi:hypothetical protein
MKTEITISFESDEMTYDEAIETYEILKRKSKSVSKFIGEPKAFRLNGEWQVTQQIKLNLRTSLKVLWLKFLDNIT